MAELRQKEEELSDLSENIRIKQKNKKELKMSLAEKEDDKRRNED